MRAFALGTFLNVHALSDSLQRSHSPSLDSKKHMDAYR